MNLTAVTERGAMMDRHIADSLSLLPAIEGALAAHCNPGGEPVKVIDIGSGAGLPGIVLAIARPGISAKTLPLSFYNILPLLSR